MLGQETLAIDRHLLDRVGQPADVVGDVSPARCVDVAAVESWLQHGAPPELVMIHLVG